MYWEQNIHSYTITHIPRITSVPYTSAQKSRPNTHTRHGTVCSEWHSLDTMNSHRVYVLVQQQRRVTMYIQHCAECVRWCMRVFMQFTISVTSPASSSSSRDVSARCGAVHTDLCLCVTLPPPPVRLYRSERDARDAWPVVCSLRATPNG